MKNLMETIREKARESSGELISLRRHFHMNPEISFREHQTADFIEGYLRKLGIRFKSGIAGTGIVAEITGEMPGNNVIALRAEMDALPVSEKNTYEYISQNEGVMHACGHDSHMAMLLCTAAILKSIGRAFAGTILIVFQPGEELSPGGARLMIESGVFDSPRPSLFLAHHVLPELEAGKVGYRAGRYMASSDEIYLTVRGKGGHAALQHLLTDQLFIASKLIIEIKETVAEEQAKVNIPTVLGFGKIRGDGATNVIPETVEIAGTLRTFNEDWRNEVKTMIRNISEKIATEFSVSIEVRIADGYPVLVNDEKLTAMAVNLSKDLLGNENVEMFDIRMSSEDFAFFTEKFPSLYYRVGVRRKGDSLKMLHSPDFDIAEEGMVTGVENMCWLALNFLTSIR